MPRICLVLTVALASVAQTSLSTQALEPFTVDDMLAVTTASVLDLTEDGRLVALSTRRLADNAETDHRRFGDPTYAPPSQVDVMVVDTRTGQSDRVFGRLTNVRQAAWTRDGSRLAILTSAESPAGIAEQTIWVWDVRSRSLSQVPRQPDATVASNSELAWLPDGSRLIVALRSSADNQAAQTAFKRLTDGPIIVHSSSEPFLDWDALRRSDRLRTVAELDPGTGEAQTLLAAARVTDYQLARDGSFITYREDVTEKTDYDVIGGTTNHLRVVRRGAGVDRTPRTVVDAKSLKTTTPRWSDDGRLFAWADKGEVFVQGIDEAAGRSVTPKPQAPAPAATPSVAGDKPADEAESFSVGSFSPDGTRLLVTSRKGWSVVTLADGSRQRVLPLDDKDEERNPRLSALGWTASGDGLLLQYGERDRWDRGVMHLDLKTRQLTPLVKDRHLYQSVRFSRDGSTVIYQRSDGDRPADVFVADGRFRNPRKLTDLNPTLARKAVPASELVAYRDADGKRLYGVLRYPVGYQKGTRYPTVFEIYETFFDNGFNARAAVLANQGYAVFHPSVNLVVGHPGEAWTKGVTAAANTLIDMGVADPDRLGVHGTSYGGYATVLLLTYTDRFKAAINISGKVNMVSFYTDSPRLGVRNTHAPEKSQDRIGGTLWEYPERYLDHSAVLRADRIKTPLLNITGDQDPNVPASQSREIYYALRRLGREVEWVRYVNGGHRPPNSVSETIDFENRIVAWYDKYLKGAAAPAVTQER